MMSEWRQFLQQAGASIGGVRVNHFGHPQDELNAMSGDILADLGHYALIRAGGTDAADFLQNQTTNDVRRVGPEWSQLNSYCSPKGRILAAFRLFSRDDSLYLRLPAELADSTLERLRKFVLMSKVELTRADDQLIRLGVAGSRAEHHLEGLVGALPGEVDGVRTADGVTVIRIPGSARFELYAEPERAMAIWKTLAAIARPVGADAWALLDIRAGLPEVYEGTVEAFVPQMVNLHVVDGVSFKKGCYPGQEVVARMQYLGTLKRRMYLAHVATETLPAPGDELFSPQSESGQGAGKVVRAAPAPEGGTDLLAVIQRSLADANAELSLHNAHGAQLELRPLPYGFPVEEAKT